MSTTVQRVAIVGGGTTAWLCAAALKHAFRHRGLDVLVLDPGRSADEPIARWTLPSVRSVHSLLGIKEVDLLRRTGATFRIASEHCGWQGDGSRFVHAHGDIGLEIKGTPFYKYLLMRAVAGHPHNPEDYSLAAVAARMRKFARPVQSPNPLTSSFTYGLHLDDVAYCDYLRSHAERLGVRRLDAPIRDITSVENGDVATLVLNDGEHIAADSFIDCSGTAALLMSRLEPDHRRDWNAWLPNDRMLMARSVALDDPPAATRTDATDAGWMWRVPLAQSSASGYVYSTAFCRDDDAVRQLTQYAPGLAEPVMIKLRQGRRTQPWTRNCIAVGAAAIELEPLVGADLHIAQLCIANLIDLFPLDANSAAERAEYNRILGEHADGLRDFTIAHYRAGAGRSSPYWTAIRSAPLPDRLANKLDLYRANGHIVLLDHETFEEVDWAWLLLGSDCRPDALSIRVSTHLAGASIENLGPLRASIDRLAASMPRHIEYVRQQR